MPTYCLKCKQNTENVGSKALKTKQCYHQKALYAVVKKSRFMKEQEAKGLLSSLSLKAPFNKIPLIGDIFLKFIFDIK